MKIKTTKAREILHLLLKTRRAKTIILSLVSTLEKIPSASRQSEPEKPEESKFGKVDGLAASVITQGSIFTETLLTPHKSISVFRNGIGGGVICAVNQQFKS